jgi:ferredoxin-type protein NapH
MKRQVIRRSVLITSLLLMPVIINYYSPFLIIMGSAEGIVVGSFVFFGILFGTSLIFGRAYCGWLCPFSGYMEALSYANPKLTNSKWGHRFKWGYWIVWIGLITYVAMTAGGYHIVNIFYQTENIISIDEPSRYLTLYFPVLGIATLLSMVLGKRAWCHYICWAGNFSALGSWIKNKARWPSLHLEAGDDCSHCKTCNSVCSKSLDVLGSVQTNSFTNLECILCGNCVDSCPMKNIKFAWTWS